VAPASPSIALGTTQQFKATALFSDGSKEDVTSLVTWVSSDTTVATVSNASGLIGLASSVAAGKATITASYPGGAGSTTLTVTAAVISSLAVTPAAPSIASGTTQQFKATATFSDKTTQDVTTTATWSSSSAAIASISNASSTQGLAQALSVGTTTITATFSGQTGTSALTVTAATLSSIAVTPATPSIAKGTTQQFTATATYSDSTTQDVTQEVTWASSNSKVASISGASGSQGLAQALLAGSTTISAALNGKSGQTTLTVTAAVVKSINVTPTAPAIAKGTAEQFTATASFTDGMTQDVTQTATWSSSDATIATISNASGSNGLAQSVGVGTSTISAVFSGKTGSTTLTVTGAVISSISLTPAAPSISKGSTQQFTATATFGDGTTQNITASATWGSSDGKVASVSNSVGSNGLATSLGVGSSTISATYSGSTGVTTLKVTAATLTAIQVTPFNSLLPVGFVRQLTATGTYSDGSKRDITTLVSWQVGDTTVASVGNSAGTQGVLTGIKAGNTAVSANLGSVAGTTLVNVTTATLSSIQVTPFTSTIPAGYSIQLVAVGTFSDHTVLDLTTQVNWQSSSTSTVTVSNATGSNGLAKGLAQGSPATITAQLSSLSGSIPIMVTAATLKSITIATAAGTNLPLGLSLQFVATGSYSDGSNQDVTSLVTWQSSNAVVGSVSNASGSNGLVSGLSAGTTGITAATGSIGSNAVSVTVTAATLQSIALSSTNLTIPIGLSKRITATGTYSDGSQRDVTNEAVWQTSDATLALVSNAVTGSGFVIPVKQGSATVTASTAGVSQQATLNVTAATLNSITVTPANPSIAVAATQQFTATGLYSDATTQDVTSLVTWSSGDVSVAQLANTAAQPGLAYGKAAGAVTVTAIDPLSSVSGTTQLTVTGP